MNRGPVVVGVSLGLVASVALAPIATAAGRFHGAGGRVIVGRPIVSHPFVHRHPFVARPFFPHPFVRPFVGFGVVAPPLYAYAAPPAYYSTPYYATPYYSAPAYDSSTYYAPPTAYAPPPGSVSVAPSPRPMQTVVEYPTGRYELRGDGVTTLYTWVWIPNPPPAPPVAPPPAGAPSQGDQPPGRQSQFYRWIDEHGHLHLTDSLDAVPKKYRAQAKQAPPS